MINNMVGILKTEQDDDDAWSSTHSCELETGLSDAKAMFKAKFCEDIDDVTRLKSQCGP